MSILASTPAAVAADDTSRFTRTLTPAERAEIGLEQLSSDEAAVLDALVRRDAATRLSSTNSRRPTTADKQPAKDSPAVLAQADAPPSGFSQRLTADERRLAGFDKLTAGQTRRLDALVERHASASVARALLSPPAYVPRGSQITPTETEERRKIHGSYSLSYGWGKGGYSERSGSMMMTYDDPAGRYSVTIGYGETHVKGGPGVYLDGPPYRDVPPYRAP